MQPEDYGLDPRYHRILPDGRLLDLSPTHCPNGHALVYPNLLRYSTNFAGRVVARWLCWECGEEWSRWPIKGARVWPGVDPGAAPEGAAHVRNIPRGPLGSPRWA